MRTPHGGFDGYHTSADALERIRPESLGESVHACLEVIEVLETNRTCVNLSPYGEPQLGRRGLYRSSRRRRATPDDERALLWVLNLSDGSCLAGSTSPPVGPPYPVIVRAAQRLEQAGLLAAAGERGS